MRRPRTRAKRPFARWREFVEFWKHDARQVACCQWAAEDELDGDAEHYNCDTCPVADALYVLDADARNRRAWSVYCRAVSRLTVEGHALGIVLERLTTEDDVEDFSELIDRLTLAFDVFNPPPEPPPKT